MAQVGLLEFRPMPLRRVFLTQLLAAVCLPGVCLCATDASIASSDQVVGATWGAIAGRVTDPSGAVIASAKVTLSSAALMAGRVTTTMGDGTYRFTALPPGEYALTFEHDGFRAETTDGVRVGVSFTATADAVLQIAAVAESVSVQRRSGVVDRHSTALGITLDADQLANLPGSRSMFSILSSTPGIEVARFEVGGSTGDSGGQYSAYGTRAFNRPTVEGIVVTGLLPYGFTFDYGAFEEVSVGLGGHSVEWPSPGVHLQFVSKSGGDQYHGTLYGDFERRDWQSYNIDAAQKDRSLLAGSPLSRDANRLWSAYDLNGDLGGFITRGRAWWFGSIRDHDVEIRQVNFPVKPSRTRLTNVTAKTTYSVDARQRLVAFAQTSRNYQPNRLDPFGPAGGVVFTAATAIHNDEASTSTQRASGILWKGEWNATVGDRLFAEARVAQFTARRPAEPNGTAPRFEDIDTAVVSGSGRSFEQLLRREQFQATASYFKDHWLGSHLLKVGTEVIDTRTEDRVYAPFPGGVLHVLRSGAPAEVYLFLTPSASINGLIDASIHAADTWRISDRLTIDAGLRFDRHRLYLPAQVHSSGAPDGGLVSFAAQDDLLTWNVVAPRLGVAVDLFGDRKTIAKLGVSRYWLPPGDLGPNVNPNAAEWWRRYVWQDANSDGIWQPGEEDTQPRAVRGGFALELLDPQLRSSWLDEISAAIERELPRRLGLRTAVVWRQDGRRYARQGLARPFDAFTDPVAIPDPGPDGIPGNFDDGAEITGYDLQQDRLGATSNIVRNAANSSSRFVTWDLLLQRRLQGRWSVSAGFSHTWHAEHANVYLGQTIRQNVYPLTPNDLINTGADGRHEFRTWTASASATLRLPKDVWLTPLARHQSGQPFGRTISAVTNYGAIRMLAEPIGSRRMDSVTLVDLRAEKKLEVFGRWSASVFLDTFNLFNTNAEQNISWASGAGFLQPLSVVSPRIARIGVRAAF
jgi:hypothetical protein